jgi:hypothetical protein
MRPAGPSCMLGQAPSRTAVKAVLRSPQPRPLQAVSRAAGPRQAHAARVAASNKRSGSRPWGGGCGGPVAPPRVGHSQREAAGAAGSRAQCQRIAARPPASTPARCSRRSRPAQASPRCTSAASSQSARCAARMLQQPMNMMRCTRPALGAARPCRAFDSYRAFDRRSSRLACFPTLTTDSTVEKLLDSFWEVGRCSATSAPP